MPHICENLWKSNTDNVTRYTERESKLGYFYKSGNYLLTSIRNDPHEVNICSEIVRHSICVGLTRHVAAYTRDKHYVWRQERRTSKFYILRHVCSYCWHNSWPPQQTTSTQLARRLVPSNLQYNAHHNQFPHNGLISKTNIVQWYTLFPDKLQLLDIWVERLEAKCLG